MKVKRLMEILATVDPEAEIWIVGRDGEQGPFELAVVGALVRKENDHQAAPEGAQGNPKT